MFGKFTIMAGAMLATGAAAQTTPPTSPASANTAPLMIRAQNPRTVWLSMMFAGDEAELTKSDEGDPLIKSKADGLGYVVIFTGCQANVECTNIQFFVGFSDIKPTLAKVNAWNANNRWSRAYVSDSGSARLEFDLNLDKGGMSRALFSDNYLIWQQQVGLYKKHLLTK